MVYLISCIYDIYTYTSQAFVPFLASAEGSAYTALVGQALDADQASKLQALLYGGADAGK
jgi:ureidoglycolate hydrolase